MVGAKEDTGMGEDDEDAVLCLLVAVPGALFLEDNVPGETLLVVVRDGVLNCDKKFSLVDGEDVAFCEERDVVSPPCLRLANDDVLVDLWWVTFSGFGFFLMGLTTSMSPSSSVTIH